MSERTDRLLGVDAARGLALLGMTAVHVLPAEAADGGTSTPHLLAAGRSAALFAVLAGVGIALATGGARPVAGERRVRWSLGLVVRAVLVAGVGLLLGELDSGVAVILAYYGLLFLAAVPVLASSPRVLLAAAVAVAVAVPALSQLVRPGLGRPLRDNPTVETLLEQPLRLLETLTVTGYYPVLAWTAYLLAGLAVGRLALGDRRVAVRLLGGGAVLAIAAGAVSAVLLGPLGGTDRIAEVEGLSAAAAAEAVGEARFGTVPTTTWWWLASDAPHSTTPLDLLHTTGTALAALGAALLAVSLLHGRWRVLLAPLAAAGSVPLTLYAAHVALLSVVDAEDETRFWLLQVAAGLALATAWRRTGRRGPLEAVVAAATRPVVGGRSRSRPH